MIKGMHAMFHTSEAQALRAFIRDRLGWKGTDVGDGWLIFDAPEADLGVHPTDGRPPSGTAEVSFYCDDIEQTVAELKGKGVEFTQAVEDYGARHLLQGARRLHCSAVPAALRQVTTSRARELEPWNSIAAACSITCT